MDLISICDSLYKRNEETSFLDLVTGDKKKWIIYNKCWAKKILGKAEWTTFSHPISQSTSKESHVLCLVGLERDPVLWAFTKQRDDKFRDVLFPIRRIKDSSWTKTSGNSESEGRRVSSGQCAASCVFDNSTKIVGARLGYSTPSTIFTRPRAFWFPPISIITKFLNGKNFNSLVEIKKSHRKNFHWKTEIPIGRNFQVAWKMEKGCRAEWHLYNLINVY